MRAAARAAARAVARSRRRCVAQVDAFYRAGALVFGGGHVVLPLLDADGGEPGWVSESAFLAGYGAAQAVPGPLFSFAALPRRGVERAARGLAGCRASRCGAIYLPSFLLLFGTLPAVGRLRGSEVVRRALTGTNAAVVGLLAAALWTPVWTSAVSGTRGRGGRRAGLRAAADRARATHRGGRDVCRPRRAL